MTDSGFTSLRSVPTAQDDVSVTNREPFAEVFRRAYGWTIDNEGYLAGLTAGDMGYEHTDVRLEDLWVDAQVAEDKRASLTRGPWPVHETMMAVVEAMALSIGVTHATPSTCGIANGDEPKTLRAKDSSQ